MRVLLGLVALLIASPALAQVAYPPAPISTLATKSEVAAVQAQIPQPSDSVPAADMATSGQVGSSARYRRPDDQAPRISRVVKQVVTAANGSAVVTWTAMPSVPGLTITEYVGTSDTVTPACFPVTGTVTTTGATIKCFVDQTLLGLGLLPRKVAGAGVTFDVLALP